MDAACSRKNFGGPGDEPKKERPTEKKKKDDKDEEEEFTGDLVLAKSCRFIYDAMISRHTTYAVADGDIGSVWECLKVRIDTLYREASPKVCFT